MPPSWRRSATCHAISNSRWKRTMCAAAWRTPWLETTGGTGGTPVLRNGDHFLAATRWNWFPRGLGLAVVDLAQPFARQAENAVEPAQFHAINVRRLVRHVLQQPDVFID